MLVKSTASSIHATNLIVRVAIGLAFLLRLVVLDGWIVLGLLCVGHCEVVRLAILLSVRVW
jgi:hypothetical protein